MIDVVNPGKSSAINNPIEQPGGGGRSKHHL